MSVAPALRILMVSEDIPAPTVGGLGKHLVRLGNHLIQQGHSVDLMGNSETDYAAYREEVGFDGRFIAGFDFKGANWKEGKTGVFMPGKRSYIARRIARAILRIAAQYDVIHYHGHYPMIGRYIPAHINFVQTRHDQGSDCPIHIRFKQGAVCASSDPRDCAGCAPNAQPGWWREQISAFAVRQYRTHTAQAFARHKTLFVSGFLRQAFLRHVPHTDPRNLHVVHNFIDTHVLPAPQPGEPGHVLFVGRIDEAKGVMALLDELARLDTHALQFDLIGDGPNRAACEARHAAPRVRFHGWQLQADALAATARAGRVVMPSILEEAFGMTTLDALALGKPVYALARGGTPELKRYERWPGQLHLFDNMAALARALVDDSGEPVPAACVPMEAFGADIRVQSQDVLRIYRAERQSCMSQHNHESTQRGTTMNTGESEFATGMPSRAGGLRYCMPGAFGKRGAGLGNEFIPWTRAYIAAQVLGAKLINPAFGRNSRGYGKYFGTSRYDWVFNKVVERVLPRIEFSERDYLAHGGGDVARAIARFAEAKRLHERSAYVLVTGGMWGGFGHIQSARDFVRARLYQSPATARNLFWLRQKLDPDKLLVTMHVRLGDFGAPIAIDAYRGKFNVALPLDWYERVADSLSELFGNNMQLLVVTDGQEQQLGKLVTQYKAVTTCGMADSDCSDLLALAAGDLAVCSVSSYSMWAAFLSDAPYLWFEPNLQQAEGFYSIWGHEPVQQGNDSPTRLAIQRCLNSRQEIRPRGCPVGVDGNIPHDLVEQLRFRLSLKQRASDLLRCGVVRMPASAHPFHPAEASLQQA